MREMRSMLMDKNYAFNTYDDLIDKLNNYNDLIYISKFYLHIYYITSYDNASITRKKNMRFIRIYKVCKSLHFDYQMIANCYCNQYRD